MGKMFLVLVCKWMDIHKVASATTQVTIERMRSTSATLGLPEVLVTIIAHLLQVPTLSISVPAMESDTFVQHPIIYVATNGIVEVVH